MKNQELTKFINEIIHELQKDSEMGYTHFLDIHKNIPNDCYDIFCNELSRRCSNYLLENNYTNNTTIAFNRVLLYINNKYINNNPLIKLEFRENPIVDCTSFVKYFRLLKNEGIITNTIDDLSDILSSITSFNPSTIKSYIGDIEKLSVSEILLPNGYGKIKKKN